MEQDEDDDDDDDDDERRGWLEGIGLSRGMVRCRE